MAEQGNRKTLVGKPDNLAAEATLNGRFPPFLWRYGDLNSAPLSLPRI
jgi:hypothetical protein